MASSFGNNIKIQIFGQSHSLKLGVVVDGLPAGFEIDMKRVQRALDRRRGGQNAYSTPRAEADVPLIVSGLVKGETCGAPLTALFDNSNVRSKDYDHLKNIPRPSHADYYAGSKFCDFNDARGGGHFSGRMTLPLVFAGAVCAQILEEAWNVSIGAHIDQIYHVVDKPFDPLNVSKDDLSFDAFPVNDPGVEEAMKQAMLDAAAEGDSVGGVIECAAIGLEVGLGSPMFEGVENRLSQAIFAIPAVRGIEFGAGFDAAGMLGSEHNDPFCLAKVEYDDDDCDDDFDLSEDDDFDSFDDFEPAHKSNHAGGVVGGLTTGAPLIFRVAFKPTPSIAKEQDSVNLEILKEVKLKIGGRHDPCIVPRAVPVVEAVTAIVLADMLFRDDV